MAKPKGPQKQNPYRDFTDEELREYQREQQKIPKEPELEKKKDENK
jgi:hypothetical protein